MQPTNEHRTNLDTKPDEMSIVGEKGNIQRRLLRCGRTARESIRRHASVAGRVVYQSPSNRTTQPSLRAPEEILDHLGAARRNGARERRTIIQWQSLARNRRLNSINVPCMMDHVYVCAVTAMHTHAATHTYDSDAAT